MRSEATTATLAARDGVGLASRRTGDDAESGARGPESTRARRRGTVTKVVLYALLVVLSVPFVYPTIWMVFSAFKPADEIFALPPTILPREWTLDGVSKIFTVTPFAQQYLNSLYIATRVTVGSIIVCALAGYAFARIRFPFAGKIFLVLMAGMMVPGEVTIIPIFRWVAELGLMDTHWPLIIVPIFGPAAIVGVFIFRQFFLSLPTELEEAGRLDGLGRLGIFARIAFPLAGPAIAAVAIMKFLASFNMYFEPLIFLRSEHLFTVSLGLTRYQDAYGEPIYNTQIGATALTVIPILIVFLFAQRQFVEGLSRTGLKG
ncbi:binding-protein-dependent transport systems inner membrane component [Beutenbergia cavernae DSM 12333]|uniref:Binding-protein-dependent transport systems inner membrane component n=1 Tax=Beutenbergia cavernae (strain ATCC BAA-8 / DSM 12333 / CCUG 43141 / JCM 11478 / NBRC 16432 / NCIMB 13614 / HKI 0122) TaxID=471853 RepID=C5BVL5_BEUC1|nr:carbohydrate ABC transporter permease [Beutenbergia cavernae]ACQ78455.1 binding-protein-dependent transport systems inner membrane component [Beutenbergia cavernae DSM 12333]